VRVIKVGFECKRPANQSVGQVWRFWSHWTTGFLARKLSVVCYVLCRSVINQGKECEIFSPSGPTWPGFISIC